MATKDNTAALKALSGLSGRGSSYSQMYDAINRKTQPEILAEGLQSATADIPQNTFAGGFLKGAAQGYGLTTKAKEASKKDRMTEYLLAQQQYAMEVQRQQDEALAEIQSFKAAQEARATIQQNIDMGLDAYQSTGDLGMLNESLNMEQAKPFKALFERQITEQGGVFQGMTATPEGDLMPYGTKADGSRIYGQAIPVEQGYSQQYLAAKQAQQLERAKAQAELESQQALTEQRQTAADLNTANTNKVNNPQATAAQPKPLSATALKMQSEALQSLSTVSGVNADIDALIGQIDSGQLDTGLVSRGLATVRTNLNSSTEADRNLSGLDSKLEGLRNAVLILNKGVQTDGDAQRAMNEIIRNKNDTALVRQRLLELKQVNQRAADLQKLQVERIRQEFGQPPLDTASYTNQPAAVGAGQATAAAPSQAPVFATNPKTGQRLMLQGNQWVPAQ